MLLEVELNGPDRSVRIFLFGLPEELCRRLDGDARRSVQITEPCRAGEHLAGRTAAAVAVPERRQGPRTHRLVREVAHGVRELRAGQIAVVRVDRWKVREDPRAVDALPGERVVREPVRLVPRQFLAEELPRPG